MKQRTKKLQFDKDTKMKIVRRQYGQCLFCSMDYHMECKDEMGYTIQDIMHYVNKSAGGLGIEENGVLGCRYHHQLLDNGNKGLREEMLSIMKIHLQEHYPNWKEEDLVHDKWRFLK